MAVNAGPKFTVPDELRNLIFEFTVSYLLEQPEDIFDFAAEYFIKARNSRKVQRISAHKAPPGDDTSILESLPSEEEVTAIRAVNRRQSVFTESYDPEEEDEHSKTSYPKTEEQKAELIETLKQILLFRSLDVEQMNEIADAMFEKNVEEGDFIICQGDDGDYFYVIQSGTYYAFINTAGEDRLIHTYEGQGSFGELALLYNQPRAATIRAGAAGTLWVLDRQTFRRIVLKSAYRKRKLYEIFMNKVPMLEKLEPYERMNLADALIPCSFPDGHAIIKQGEAADGMYFVESGTVSVRVTDEKEQEIEISRVGEGGYFGELALITHKPRAASVYCSGPVKAAFLDVEAFERLLGPCMEIMKRNMEDYKRQLPELLGSPSDVADIR